MYSDAHTNPAIELHTPTQTDEGRKHELVTAFHHASPKIRVYLACGAVVNKDFLGHRSHTPRQHALAV
ncbi:hypothetical protein E2C01_000749 [Portunus trituberculatus]|uniref:Uncharacterized protein n=1 Tax=Portunus trituberculatus TaxID=210409 RepID=A0A5B7CEY3_PORTR|nr:hypothetical protein [Portunus trituberculatus]